MSVLVVAECASTHDGEWEKAARLVELASECGFDCCKFQFWSNPEKLAVRRNAFDYLPIYQRYQMPVAWLEELEKLCYRLGLEFMATTYLEHDIAIVAPYVKRFKVSSFEAGDKAFLEAHKPFKKPVIVSTGMMDEGGVIELFRPFVGAILHCTTAYPCPLEDANLRFLSYFVGRRTFKPLGLSDHTRHVLTGALAVAAGAEIVEVHVRLDDTHEANPDYAVSLSPDEAKEYVENIRLAETMMGDGVKRVQPSEEPMMAYRVKA